MKWQRIEKPDFGYAVHVPHDWDERPPNLKNSPWETARFGDQADRRRSVVVFRGPTRPGRTAEELIEQVTTSLGNAGFTDFESTGVRLGGRAGMRLDCARHDAGRMWAVREYFVAGNGVYFCLALGSAVPGEDEALFDAMAERFEIFEVS
ncbi:hypothetical protein [Actinomadura sp. DC4]|uniref:hypothetical protein n=1 Tax=Actinomadura sp. DC4 TaxID=3055069 RepID=UPI0025AECFC7|nr:hypothetical protein [Actinomadura sp. DC4]MDN3350993.1 hypothetical protein [Actinomadura sp. DC4]